LTKCQVLLNFKTKVEGPLYFTVFII